MTNHEPPYNLKILCWASTHLLSQSPPTFWANHHPPFEPITALFTITGLWPLGCTYWNSVVMVNLILLSFSVVFLQPGVNLLSALCTNIFNILYALLKTVEIQISWLLIKLTDQDLYHFSSTQWIYIINELARSWLESEVHIYLRTTHKVLSMRELVLLVGQIW